MPELIIERTVQKADRMKHTYVKAGEGNRIAIVDTETREVTLKIANKTYNLSEGLFGYFGLSEKLLTKTDAELIAELDGYFAEAEN